MESAKTDLNKARTAVQGEFERKQRGTKGSRQDNPIPLQVPPKTMQISAAISPSRVVLGSFDWGTPSQPFSRFKSWICVSHTEKFSFYHIKPIKSCWSLFAVLGNVVKHPDLLSYSIQACVVFRLMALLLPARIQFRC